MATIDAQPDALAGVYARALMELAEAKGGREEIESVLGQLEDLTEMARAMPQFGEFMRSQAIPASQRAASLEKMLKGRVSDLVLRFILVVNEKGRLGHFGAIVASFDSLVQHKFGRVEVDVYTASPVSPEELRAIRERLQQAIGRETIVHPYTDNTMLGGVKIQIGDRLIDGSLATQLAEDEGPALDHGPGRTSLARGSGC
jgi:F-type H+-transporting ATPase subunit delta